MKIYRLFWLLSIPICLQLLNLFCLHFDHNFHSKDFAHGFRKTSSTDISGLDYSLLDQIFKQPFHYLGNGKQMVALESADQRYVLKLFNPMRPLKKNWYKKWKYWQRYSSIKWIKREWFQKQQRLQKLFDRHQISYEKMRQETGLIFLHLSSSEKVAHSVTVRDAQGKLHQLNLAKTPFVLQEKAVLVPVYLNQLLQQGEVEKAKLAILKMQELFEKRLAEGITDRIQTMENNYGFVGDKPIQIDVGRIRLDPTLQDNMIEEKNRILENFTSWIHNNYPALQ